MGEGTRRWGGRRQARCCADKRACAPGPHVQAAGRRGGGKLGSWSPGSGGKARGPEGAMEPAPALGLGDSSLHRYLDGEFWSLKNELRRLLGGCPLFRHRYRAAAAGQTGRVPSVTAGPSGHCPGRSGPGPGGIPYPVQMMDSPRQWCAQRTRPPTSRARREGGLRLPSSLLRRVGVKGWARSSRRGAPLRLVAGRFGSASRSRLLDCPPLMSHPGRWEKGQRNQDAVGVDGAQGRLAAVSANRCARAGAREPAGQRGPWTLSWHRDGLALHRAYVGVWGGADSQGPPKSTGMQSGQLNGSGGTLVARGGQVHEVI